MLKPEYLETETDKSSIYTIYSQEDMHDNLSNSIKSGFSNLFASINLNM